MLNTERMADSDPKLDVAQRLRGKCVLIVEDECFIADDLAKGFGEAGISTAGPVPSLAKALSIIEEKRIDGAVLDINLDGDKVYAAADALIARSVPLVFVTGYDASVIPSRFASVPFCQKPVGSPASLRRKLPVQVRRYPSGKLCGAKAVRRRLVVSDRLLPAGWLIPPYRFRAKR